LRGRVLGALNLLDAKDGTLSDPEIWPVAR